VLSRWQIVLAPCALAACDGPQSALDPAGRDAERIAGFFWWMGGGALVIWLAVVGLAVYAIRLRPEPHGHGLARWLIIGGGAIFPSLVLLVLLVFGLAALPPLLALPPLSPGGGLVIEVTGVQWWWRVRYALPDGSTVELANELRLPVHERVRLELESADVIHSFWAPALAGKLDMIPGRTTSLALEPVRTGTVHGACAEYCGTSHARMGFRVVVSEREEFDAWLAAQARPAREPTGPAARAGAQVFLATGCGACHTVRGTPADGRIGPDLTHVASRRTLAAGVLPTDRAAFLRWIARPDALKPGAHMPPFEMLPDDELAALAAWLAELE
jgi:cytochrome c oxidase subunit 2